MPTPQDAAQVAWEEFARSNPLDILLISPGTMRHIFLTAWAAATARAGEIAEKWEQSRSGLSGPADFGAKVIAGKIAEEIRHATGSG